MALVLLERARQDAGVLNGGDQVVVAPRLAVDAQGRLLLEREHVVHEDVLVLAEHRTTHVDGGDLPSERLQFGNDDTVEACVVDVLDGVGRGASLLDGGGIVEDNLAVAAQVRLEIVGEVAAESTQLPLVHDEQGLQDKKALASLEHPRLTYHHAVQVRTSVDGDTQRLGVVHVRIEAAVVAGTLRLLQVDALRLILRGPVLHVERLAALLHGELVGNQVVGLHVGAGIAVDVDVEVGVEAVAGGTLLLAEDLDAEHQVGELALHLPYPRLAAEHRRVLDGREVPEGLALRAQQVELLQEHLVLCKLDGQARIGLLLVFQFGEHLRDLRVDILRLILLFLLPLALLLRQAGIRYP